MNSAPKVGNTALNVIFRERVTLTHRQEAKVEPYRTSSLRVVSLKKSVVVRHTFNETISATSFPLIRCLENTCEMVRLTVTKAKHNFEPMETLTLLVHTVIHAAATLQGTESSSKETLV